MLTDQSQSLKTSGWSRLFSKKALQKSSAEPAADAVSKRQQLRHKRQQLRQQLGVEMAQSCFQRPQEYPFTKNQRAHTTILFGGLTWKHEQLIQAFAEPLGYRFEPLPVPTVAGFQTGKEFGNNGQCNPTYFTVGNLVSYLQQLQASGVSRQEIIDNYVFFTAGACGPCRFGMYEAEFRLALQNAGFDGFRVILFQQKNGIFQGEEEQGLNLDVVFFLNLLNAFVIGDQLNEVAYRIRPYETHAGDTDKVLQRSIARIAETMKLFNTRKRPGLWSKLGLWYQLLFGRLFTDELKKIADDFDAISVDYLQPKPIAKITGEFWAQTTEGDGNYHMFTFLEKEQAQVLVEPIGTWITYLLHQALQKTKDQFSVNKHWAFRSRLLKKILMLKLGEKIFTSLWNRYRHALKSVPHPLVDQYHLKELASTHYNSRAQGGEGHLEVGKNIYYSSNNLCHMVLSLKPFGCMPSTQSDGVQSAIVNQYPDMIFLPLETSGESEVNAHSRVQMALGEARNKARSEFQTLLDSSGYSLQQIKEYVLQKHEFNSAMQPLEQPSAYAGVAARFLFQVTDSLKKHAYA